MYKIYVYWQKQRDGIKERKVEVMDEKIERKNVR